MPHFIYDKSIIELLALYLLQKEDLYAYNIMKKIRKFSGEAIAIQAGSLYPILYKFVDQGIVTDRFETVGKRQRMTRVYYHLTPQGEEYLRHLMEERVFVQSSIDAVLENASKEEPA